MENKLQLFKNSEFGSLEILTIDGKPYFPATRCARVLGYKNPQEAIRTHCKGVRETLTPTHNQHGAEIMQSVKYIPEGDLYRLIIRSKLPAAERFERWVFDEVVPAAVRKELTGTTDIKTIVALVTEGVTKSIVAILPELIAQTMAVQVQSTPAELMLLGHMRSRRRATNRQGYKMESFPAEIQEYYKKMRFEMNLTYDEIAMILTAKGYPISDMSVLRYTRHLEKTKKSI